MRAAMIVPGIGLVVLAVFVGAGFLTSNPVQQTNHSTRAFTVPGTSLRAEPAAHVLEVIAVAGQPPSNVINSVSIPEGATRTAFMNKTASVGSYDAQITLTANLSQGAVETFYRKALKTQGWQIISNGPADHLAGGLEVLAKKAGSDGFYWDIAAVVSPTSFGPGAPAAGDTRFTLELYQESDPGT
jgi:phage baseplate assembly protein gpV